jgi:hypothetical protein
MKKRIGWIIVTLSVLLPAAGFAQQADSGVELRLKLIQSTEGSHIRNLVLSLSVINHTSGDVYVPMLRLLGYLHDIHLYRRQTNGFTEIDLLGQQPPGGGDAIFSYSGTSVTHYYWKNSMSMLRQQDSLIRLLYDSLHNPVVMPKPHMKMSEINIPQDQPLFLKAGQHLDNFQTLNIEHILRQSGEYKIDWRQGKESLTVWPATFLEYKLYRPARIIANPIYFDNLTLDQLQQQ